MTEIMPGLPGGPPYRKPIPFAEFMEAVEKRFQDMTIHNYAKAQAYIKWFRV